MYKVHGEGGNQLSADHKQKGVGGFTPNFCQKNGGISVNGVFKHFPYTHRRAERSHSVASSTMRLTLLSFDLLLLATSSY